MPTLFAFLPPTGRFTPQCGRVSFFLPARLTPPAEKKEEGELFTASSAPLTENAAQTAAANRLNLVVLEFESS